MNPMPWQLSCVTVTNDCSLLFVIVHHNVCSLLLRVTEGSFKLRSSMLAKTLYEYGRSRWSADQGTPAASAPRNRSDSELVDLAVTVDGFSCSMLGYGRVLNLDCLKQISFRSKSTLTPSLSDVAKTRNTLHVGCALQRLQDSRLFSNTDHQSLVGFICQVGWAEFRCCCSIDAISRRMQSAVETQIIMKSRNN